ncbi:MAG: hypothetical protein R6X29_12045 [Acidimicrobiia bacterium]|jgi:hypothetical protein
METQAPARVMPIRTSWAFIANSVVGSILGLASAFLAYHVGLGVGGWIAGRDPELLNTGTVFRAEGSDLAYLGGVAGALVLALLLLSLYPQSRDRSAGRLVMLWTILFAFVAALADFVRAYTDGSSPVALALAELELPGGLDAVLAVAGVLGLALVAVSAAAAFLGFARHQSEVANRTERMRFVGRMALVPGVVGPLLATPLFLGAGDERILPLLPFVGLFTVVTVLAASGSVSFRAPAVVEERGFSWGLLVALVIAFLVFRVVLASGIPIPPWDENLRFDFE